MRQSKQVKNKIFSTQQSLNRAIKGICDVLRRSNCAGAMQYIPELTWILFLRILDEQETLEAEKAQSAGKDFFWSMDLPYRWQAWGSPYMPSLFHNTHSHKPPGWKRQELTNKGEGYFLDFVNNELFPYLKSLSKNQEATARQKVIGEIASNIDRTRIDTEYNLLDVLNRVHLINMANINSTHIFPLSQVYEGLLLQMGQKSNDGGQFFTPREVIRTIVKVIAPRPDTTIYDPCCGTGGFLAEAHEYVRQSLSEPSGTPPERSDRAGHFYGREKENLVYPLALANLILHGIDEPHIWHGNTLTGNEIYGDLFQNAPSQFDVIMTNPPFGGKESKEAQIHFPYKSSSTQLLFLQHVIDSLVAGGRCGIVVDEGVLFRTTDVAFVQTKRKLLETCNLWCIVSLPIGTFSNVGASIKTNILFFTKGELTNKVWYYDLSDIKINKATPLTAKHFDEFFQLLPHFADSERSWSITRKQIEENGYDLKAVNPNFRLQQEKRSLHLLLKLMEEKNNEIQKNLEILELNVSATSDMINYRDSL